MPKKARRSSKKNLSGAVLVTAGVLCGALAMYLAFREKPYRPHVTDFYEHSDAVDRRSRSASSPAPRSAQETRGATGSLAGPKSSKAPSIATSPAATTHAAPVATVPKSGPRVAFVLDDWGYNMEAYEYLSAIREPLTLAVLPALPYSSRIAHGAERLGHEVILHMPMEAQSNVPREKIILLAGMPARDVEKTLSEAFASLPGVKGVSNHQGSRATEDPVLMREVVSALKKRGLYFFDSLTTDRSAVPVAAAESGVPYVRRDVFLDNVRTEEAIQARLDDLQRTALARGVAVGVGHDKSITLQMIERNIPEFKKKGIRIVALSDLYKS